MAENPRGFLNDDQYFSVLLDIRQKSEKWRPKEIPSKTAQVQSWMTMSQMSGRSLLFFGLFRYDSEMLIDGCRDKRIFSTGCSGKRLGVFL